MYADVFTECERLFKDWTWASPLLRPSREKICKWPWCQLYIYWSCYFWLCSLDSFHDERMGLCDGMWLIVSIQIWCHHCIVWWDSISQSTTTERYFWSSQLPVISLSCHHSGTTSTSASSTSSSTSISGESALAHISQILSSVVSMTQGPLKQPTMPAPPQECNTLPTVLSLITNTPSKLPWFLKYAETKLGVQDAIFHEHSVRERDMVLIYCTSLMIVTSTRLESTQAMSSVWSRIHSSGGIVLMQSINRIITHLLPTMKHCQTKGSTLKNDSMMVMLCGYIGLRWLLGVIKWMLTLTGSSTARLEMTG